MGPFTTGMLAGGIIAAVGVGMMMSCSKTRRKIEKGRRRAMRKTEDIVDGITDLF